MNSEHIPKEIKLITLARSIRWFGWGMCETLIPVLLFSFSHSYIEAGFFRSVYDIVFLLALPVVSIFADRVSAKFLLLTALAIYPLIGLSYFMSGIVGAAFFVLLARIINGVAWCCDSVGGDTYIRRFALTNHLSKSFGYLSSLPNFSWILAALISIPLIPFVPVHWFFLAIVPTSIAAYFVVKSAPTDKVPVQKTVSKKYVKNFIEAIKGIGTWKLEVWVLAFLAFFISCIDLLGTFFVPLFAYTESNNLVHVIVITVIFAIPSAFAFWFGAIIDKVSKVNFIAISISLIAGLLILLSYEQWYIFQLLGIFILGVLTLCANLALQALVTQVSHRDHYGRVSGLMSGADEFGSVIGPLLIGLLIDQSGMNMTFVVLGILAIVIVITTKIIFTLKPVRIEVN